MSLAAPPLRISLAVAVVCILLAWAATAAVGAPPWLGASLVPDPAAHRIRIERLAPGGPLASALAGREAVWLTGAAGVRLTDIDRIEEPDVLPSYAAIDAFLARQNAVTRTLGNGPARLDLADAKGAPFSVTVQPGRRPVNDLPVLFWMQLVFGGGALFISGWVWSLRPRDPAVRLFALTGLGLGIGADAAAVYSSRELSLDGAAFRILSATNHFGGLLFGAAMVAVFCLYPRALLKRPAPLIAMAAACAAVWIADTARWAPSPLIGGYLPILSLSLAIVALIGVQTWRNRRDPVASAGLRWLGVAVVAGIGGFVAANAIPAVLGGPAIAPQALTLGPFLLIYIGLAMGLGRYGLFQLDRWAYRTIFYTVGALAVLAMDAALLLLLRIERAAALGVAVLAIGLAYLPLRDVLWRRITAQRQRSDDHLHRDVMETVFHARDADREAGWRALMQRLFEPLDIDSAAAAAESPVLGDDGRDMIVPNVAPHPALILRFARGGRSVFSSKDLALASHALSLLRQAEAGREAYDRGAAEERLRIGRDLDADVAARLRAGLDKPDIPQTRAVLRDAIAEIRVAVGALSGGQRTLGEVLADLRHETHDHLDGAGVALAWPLCEAEDGVLDGAGQKALRDALREGVSQALAVAPQVIAVGALCEAGAVRLSVAADGAAVLDRAFALPR